MATYASLLSLEKEVKKKTENPPTKNKTVNRDKGKKRSRSRSPRQFKRNKPTGIKVPKEEEIYLNWDIPDRQYGDLYCKPCDSHMNSQQMWEAHIQGKRHLRTVKKGEAADIRYTYVDEEPLMIDLLNEETRPIVGLHHLVEVQRLEQRPLYHCFLCSGSIPTPELLIEHILGTKHRLFYLREHDLERYKLILNSGLKKGFIEPVVEECIEKHERDQGRGKMLVKREKELTEAEKERANRQEYSYSHAAKAKNKSKPSLANSSKKNDFDDLPESTNNYNRSKDWDRERSIHSDRSFEGYPDDSGRRSVKDRELDYHTRSPDRRENHSRSSYPARYSPDMLSPDNEYRKRMEKNRLAEERHRFARYTPERESFIGASENDRYHSVPQGTGIHGPRSALDDRYGDLREVLEKKKTSVDPYLRETNSSHSLLDKYTLASKETSNHNLSSFYPKSDAVGNPFSSSLSDNNSSSIARGRSTLNVVSDVPDDYLQLIEAMSPKTFLQLALFKINRITISTEMELQLLDKLSTKTSALSMEIKANQLPKNLQDQFKETMVKSGISINPQFSKDFEQIMEMVGQVKASSNLGGGNSINLFSDAPISQPAYSTPTYVSSDMAISNSGIQHGNKQDYNPQGINRSSWQHVDSNAPQSANSSMFGSSSYIPGLTITDNQSNDTSTSASYSSPFEVMYNQAKDILQGVRTKTDSHRF